MRYTVMETLKNFFWYSIANSIFDDATPAMLNDETFLRDVKNSRNTTIHLQKKHFPLIVKKAINDLLDKQKYTVTSIKYRFHGMDVFVSHQK